MAESTHQSDSEPLIVTSPAYMWGVSVKVVTWIVSILVLLSLISYHPADTAILEKGTGEFAQVHNWIGIFGASISNTLFIWIGFAAYPGIILVLMSIAVRLYSQSVRPFQPVYLAGVAATVLGLAMFMGIFPDFIPQLADHLNITKTPGGVLGQRLCAPRDGGNSAGWLTAVVNPAGSGIIAVACIAVGAVTIWYFDWQSYTSRALERVRAKLKERRLAVEEKTLQQAAIDDRIDSFATDADMSVTQDGGSKQRKPKRARREQPRKKSLPESSGELPTDQSAPSKAPAQPAKTSGKTAAKVSDYTLPDIGLLASPGAPSLSVDAKELSAKKLVLQETLDSFGIDGTVGSCIAGPRVALFEIKPAAGVKVERISALANNIAMMLKAESLRILTPIPGRDTVGIEVPNSVASTVTFREILNSATWRDTRAAIPVALGRNIAGKPVILDLARAPHLLIAGATGSGKSVCINALILSLLYRFTPEDLRLIMVDPKVVEFSGYSELPHLATPIVTNVKKVPIALRWALNQMEWRYQILAKAGVRNIASYNARELPEKPVFLDNGDLLPDKLPFIVLIIDELADIIMTAKADVETSLARIAQLARAVGIHAVIATQRPSVNVITGVIKANFPTRIAFQVASVVDSRTILDSKGAESLLGAGDMLFKPPGGSRLERTQGAFVADDEIQSVVEFCSQQMKPSFLEDIFTPETPPPAKGAAAETASGADVKAAEAAPTTASGFTHTPAAPSAESGNADEELVQKAIETILLDQRATISHVQRRLRIGYNRAALIIEELESRGIIGPQIGTSPREILIADDRAEAAEEAAEEDEVLEE